MALGKARARCIKAIYLTYVGCSFAIELCTFLGGLGCKFAPIRSLGITLCKNTTDVRKEARRTCRRKSHGTHLESCWWRAVRWHCCKSRCGSDAIQILQIRFWEVYLGDKLRTCSLWETVGIGQHGSRGLREYNATYLRSSSHLRSSKNVWQQACDKTTTAILFKQYNLEHGRDPAKQKFIQPFFGQIDFQQLH